MLFIFLPYRPVSFQWSKRCGSACHCKGLYKGVVLIALRMAPLLQGEQGLPSELLPQQVGW